MSGLERTKPHRFRRRLTAAFVLVAAISSGTLALVTYGLASSYRWRNFEDLSRREVRLALALAPSHLDEATFQNLLHAYEKRAGTDTVAIGSGGTYSSSELLAADVVPARIRDGEGNEIVDVDLEINGQTYLVVGGRGPDGSRYAFFFSLEQLTNSLTELRNVLVVGWAAIVVISAAVGDLVARRALRPVREAAEATTAMAAGELQTRLPTQGRDEFGTWAESFNRMADALETKIDELAKAAERERQFTADVAHDLRTPLTGMVATASLLNDHLDDVPPDMRRAVAVITRDVARMRDLVLELLELSRLDAGSEPVLFEDLVVVEALDATVDSLGLPDSTRVIVDVMPDLHVWAERGRFRRIVSNLVTNAATHGSDLVTIRAEHRGDGVTIDVSDDGPGIAGNDLEHIFERFYKSDASRTKGGSGLGLAIARDHARAQHGDITARNAPGGGACFTLTLPCEAQVSET